MTSDNATEEYKRISEFMRTYLLLRLYRLTLLLGTSGAIVTALASENIQARGAVVILLLKVSALGISAAFAVMDFSASGHWVRLRARANELAAVLGYQVFRSPPDGVPSPPRVREITFIFLWCCSGSPACFCIRLNKDYGLLIRQGPDTPRRTTDSITSVSMSCLSPAVLLRNENGCFFCRWSLPSVA